MISLLLRAAADGGAEEHSILLPHTYDLVWSLVVFIPLVLAFIYFVMPKFRVVLDERTAKIQQGIDDAEEAHVALTHAQQNAEALKEEGIREAAKIRAKANDEAAKIISDAKHQATLEAQRINEVARAQIEAERQSAFVSLKKDVGGLATELAEKIIGEHLKDQALTGRVVDRFLDDLEKELVTQEA